MATKDALELAGKGGLAFAQMAASFAPVPGLLPALQVACAIAILCENVISNKIAARQLSDRCMRLLETIRNEGKGWQNQQMDEATRLAELLLTTIHKRMTGWKAQGRVNAFLRQRTITQDIKESNQSIDNLCERIQIASHMGIHKWQQDFEQSCKEDFQQVFDILGDISQQQQLFLETQRMQQQADSSAMRDMMDMMQNHLATMQLGDPRHNMLQRNLHYFQRESGDLLPDLELKRGEVRRMGKYAVGGSNAMDVWEGIYLDDEKVSIKVMRAVHSNEKNMNRFKREVKLWARLWDVDKGKHILPIYGFCQTDGPYPYIVSQWQPNGTAIKYVQQNPHVNHKKLILGIAKGLRVLHTMTPMIIHGDLRGENIQVTTDGSPLLSDFGLSKMVEDMSDSATFTQSKGVSDSSRFMAPELMMGPSTMAPSCDIWSFAMTTLQLLTAKLPFAQYRSNTEVVIQCHRGKRPLRPTDEETIRKGLTEGLWLLLERCWVGEPEKRPSIDEVIADLEYLFS